MKIKRIVAVPISPPPREYYGRPHQTALGEFLNVDYGFVKIETDEGHFGVGEICTVFQPGGHTLCQQIDDHLAPVLLGEDPHRINYLVAAMDLALCDAEPAKAAIDMALFDIVGKSLKTPVYNLLGGMVRERVPLSHAITYGSSDEMAGFATQLTQEGFKTIKVKVGQGLEKDVDAVRAIRQAIGPSVKLRVDANMSWSTAKEAIFMIRQLEKYGIEIVEQPVPRHAIDAMAEVRKMTDHPIMADESVWTPMDAIKCIKRKAVDVVSVYVAESGGLLKAARTFSICEAAGIPCLIGCMPGTGIDTAAQIHLGVAMSNLKFDSDSCGVRYFSEDCLVQPLKIEDGYAYPPEGVGLGIEVDESVLSRWKIAAQNNAE